MKKVVISMITVLAMLLPLYAGTSATLQLQGTISDILDISVTEIAGVTNNLDFTTTQSDLSVATANEKSNSESGYRVLLSSLNNSNFKHSIENDTIAYTLKYGEVSVDLSSSNTVPQLAVSVTTTGVTTNTRDISISYNAVTAANIRSGIYSDIITLTIEAL